MWVRINQHLHIHHKHYQLVITGGSVACCVIAIALPAYGGLGAIVGCITNLVWVWEASADA